MSLTPGGLKVKDPAAVKNAAFNWGTYLAAGVLLSSPTVTVSGPDAALITANVALATGNRQVNYTISAGTVGAKYTVTCHISTNETPPQTDERSFQVLVQNR
jgi:hypothetical protein